MLTNWIRQTFLVIERLQFNTVSFIEDVPAYFSSLDIQHLHQCSRSLNSWVLSPSLWYTCVLPRHSEELQYAVKTLSESNVLQDLPPAQLPCSYIVEQVEELILTWRQAVRCAFAAQYKDGSLLILPWGVWKKWVYKWRPTNYVLGASIRATPWLSV